MRVRGALACLLIVLSTGTMRGQSAAGAIAGVVRDSSGSPVAGASVCVRDPHANTAHDSATDSAGSFHVGGLTPAAYEVTVSKDGFRASRQRDVSIASDRTASLAFQLEVGPVSETVDVHGAAGGVDVEDQAINNVFSFLELLDLVQDDRIITNLAYLRAGVARRASGGLGSGYVVGGARADNTNFVLDGFSDYDPRTGSAEVMPNYDAIEEFRVQSYGGTAEFGRLAGGVMNMMLRSGGNRLHATLFEMYRSSALGARNYFDVAKSELLSNQFGVTLSGPLIVPRIYHGANKTFFLLSWEGLNLSSGVNSLSNVPTALERNGDFSASLNSSGRPLTVTDPLTGKPFPGNFIPASRFDPAATGAAAYFPLPDHSGNGSNYQTNQVNHNRWNSVLLKFDERPWEKTALAFRYVSRPGATDSPYTGSALGIFGSHAHSRPTLAGITWTEVLGVSAVNELRAGIIRTSDHEAGQFSGRDMNVQFGLSGISSDPYLAGFPVFNIQNLASLGDAPSMPFTFTVNNYEIADILSITRGRHLIKTGADVLRTQFFQGLNNNVRGTYNFLGRWTSDPFADFLLGLPDSTSRQSSTSPAYLFTTNTGIFVQDQVQLSTRFTLNLGVRYEYTEPPHEKYGRISSFVPPVGEVVIGSDQAIPNLAQLEQVAGLSNVVTTARKAGLPSSLVYANRHDFAPRFGFSWRPFSGGKTVVRGGAGIYFADSLLDPIRNALTNVYPFTVSQTFNRMSSQPNALTLRNPFPASLATLPGVTNVNGFSLHPGAQYLDSYTLSFERQLVGGALLEVDYAGSRGTHLGQQYDLNQPFRQAAFQLPGGAFPRPYAPFGTIEYFGFGGNSVYNEGSATLRRAFARGWFVGASYVYSKSIDDASQIAGSSQGDFGAAQNSRDLAGERGRSDWDTGHSFLLFGSYQLPKGHTPWLRGWQVSTTVRLYTGQPFTPRVENANLSLGEAVRPNRVGKGAVAAPSVSQWFDVPAFPIVPQKTFAFGNSGRNILDGPGNISWNTALLKNFRIADRGSAQFRCEVINVLNHANLGLPVNYVDVSNAGQILSAGAGRSIQFGLRFQF